MKKKAIEKIPYLKLQRVSKKKKVEYVAMTAVTQIGQEDHLFIEVYRNRKGCLEVPVVRIAMTEKDFGTYFTETGTWSRGRITKNDWNNNGLIWREEVRAYKTRDELEEENVLHSPEDMERIRDFTKVKLWKTSEWWEYIDRKQEEITREEYAEKSGRRWLRRRKALEEREAHTEDLPEQEILEYADRFLFQEKHYLYYKKRGARAAVACSKCGGVAEGRWRPGESYESKFEKLIEEPVAGIDGTCPLCQAKGMYMPQGRAGGRYSEVQHLFLGQKYREQGMVFRYIEVEKEWILEQMCAGKEKEMIGASEELTGIELARAYFEPGKKVQKDYKKHDPWADKDFWDDCNLGGMHHMSVKNACIMPETYQNMKDTFLQYSALEEYERAAGENINPVEYMERYIQTPQIEMLVKMRLTGVVKGLVSYRYGIVADESAKRADEFLGIRKERVKQLIRRQGDIGMLDTMQLEKRQGQRWTEEQIEQVTELGLGDEIRVPLQYMGIQKLLNRVAKYAGCGYGTMCGTAQERLRDTARTYIDYLTMREALGYDLHNTVYLYPRDLEEAHDRMVTEQNRKKADERIRKVNEKYPMIKKHYRRLRKKFCFEDEEFMIRPARDAGEIVMEGRILHHCVGGDSYLKKHDTDQSTILFLRFKERPETPYITVEIGTDSLKILQWYGDHDRKPEEDRMQRWLEDYVTRLKCRRDGTLKEAGKEAAGETLLMAAV